MFNREGLNIGSFQGLSLCCLTSSASSTAPRKSSPSPACLNSVLPAGTTHHHQQQQQQHRFKHTSVSRILETFSKPFFTAPTYSTAT